MDVDRTRPALKKGGPREADSFQQLFWDHLKRYFMGLPDHPSSPSLDSCRTAARISDFFADLLYYRGAATEAEV